MSSTCHPQRVTCAHEHTTKSPLYVTHDEWPLSPTIVEGSTIPPASPTCFTSGFREKSPIMLAKQTTTAQASVSFGRHQHQTLKRARLGTLPFKAIKGSLAEGRDRIARTSSEVDNYYKIAFSTLSIGVNRCSSCDLNLVGSDCQ